MYNVHCTCFKEVFYFLQDVNYPVNGKDKIYQKGMNLIIDSYAHTQEKDMTFIRDYSRNEMYYSGKLEHEDTPVDGLDQPKLLIHNKNEIPLFLGPSKQYLTLDRYYGYSVDSVGEIKIPLKVSIIILYYSNPL